MKKLILLLIGILMLGGSLAGCTNTPGAYKPSIPAPVVKDIFHASDYDAVLTKLTELSANGQYYATPGVVSWNLAIPPATITVSNTMTASSSSQYESSDYSKTNVQVQGIDEADIILTDGKYIYSLQNGLLYIFIADGENTRLLTKYSVLGNDEKTVDRFSQYNFLSFDSPTSASDTREDHSENAIEMYISGENIVIITQSSTLSYTAIEYTYTDWYTKKESSYFYWYLTDQELICKAYVVNVSDRQKPVAVHEIGQDGYYLSSRLKGTTLYLLSTYTIFALDETNPLTFVPCIYNGDNKSLISPAHIAIMPYAGSRGYTVISAIDINSGTIEANQSLLGGGTMIYMSENNLYVTGYDNKCYESTTISEKLTVKTYLYYTNTNITRLDIANGGLKLVAHGCVTGTLLNQFAMDEYNGYLRVVSTDNSYWYSQTTDMVTGNINYSNSDWQGTTNGLYVLDMSLNMVGSVDNLAKGERVYSVRFDGSIGYFVTFRLVDPLFAVDLSNPSKPKVLSALKIPGFSQYLHVFSDGLLFGLGYDADEETGRMGNMKISMFNTSDPANVTEAHTYLINGYYSSASYNHKAILIDANKNIIAFPVDNEYIIFGYDAKSGFYLKSRISVTAAWWLSNSRGLYINDNFYVVSDNHVTVIDMDAYEVVLSLSYN